MEYLLVIFVAYVVSFLSLLSGFGIGTLLMPVLALFFPLPIAISSTAVVHLLSNIFKVMVVGKYAEKKAVLQFGISAALFAILGAFFLTTMVRIPPLFSYSLFSHSASITLLGAVIGAVIMFSSFFVVFPGLGSHAWYKRYVLGGAISGFFGGLSGHQGMFRSAFLVTSGLEKMQMIGTGAVCSLFVDLVRIPIYGWELYGRYLVTLEPKSIGVILLAILSACLGVYTASKTVYKISFSTIRFLIGFLLFFLGFCIGLGWI